MSDGLAEYYEAQIDAAQQVQAEKSARLMCELYGEDVLEAAHCNKKHIPGCPNGDGGADAKAVKPIPRNQWKYRTLPKEADADKARKELEGDGVTVKDPTGTPVHMGRQLYDHWKKDGHLDRLKHLNLLKLTIRQPHEIWVDKDGARTYVAAYIDPMKPGSKYAIAFTTGKATMEINTFWHESNQAGGKRAGTLIYAHR